MFTSRLPALVRCASRSGRSLSTTRPSRAVTPLTMPALSPTMTEGSVSEWKFKEGESFVAGDVLLGIETDKASIDVEAQDDGIMGKIVIQNGTSGVEVGAIIAMLAEEGDDISNIVVPSIAAASTPPPPTSAPAPTPAVPKAEPSTPKAAPAPAPTPAPVAAPAPRAHGHPTHPRPLLPSVLRLLSIAGIEDATVVTATGHRGMLTKGDVLAFLGEIPSARGSEKAVVKHAAPEAKTEEPKKPLVEMDGSAFRRLIAEGLGTPPVALPGPKSAPVSLGFDDVLDQYLPPAKRSSAKKVVKDVSVKKDSFDSVLEL